MRRAFLLALMDPWKNTDSRGTEPRICHGHTSISIGGRGSSRAYIVRGAGARGGNTEIPWWSGDQFHTPQWKMNPQIKPEFKEQRKFLHGCQLPENRGDAEKMKLASSLPLHPNRHARHHLFFSFFYTSEEIKPSATHFPGFATLKKSIF